MTVLAPAVDRSLGEIVPRLLNRFSSREGYKLYDDTLPTCECLLTFDVSLLTRTLLCTRQCSVSDLQTYERA